MTVNFPCSHCKSLMAVPPNLVGRNVRCPTCKQVVQAPAAPPTTAPLPTPKPPEIDLFPASTPQTDEPESIFGEQHDDDLFGTRAPKVELPGAAPLPVPQRCCRRCRRMHRPSRIMHRFKTQARFRNLRSRAWNPSLRIFPQLPMLRG